MGAYPNSPNVNDVELPLVMVTKADGDRFREAIDVGGQTATRRGDTCQRRRAAVPYVRDRYI